MKKDEKDFLFFLIEEEKGIRWFGCLVENSLEGCIFGFVVLFTKLLIWRYDLKNFLKKARVRAVLDFCDGIFDKRGLCGFSLSEESKQTKQTFFFSDESEVVFFLV